MALADESFGDYWLDVVAELKKVHGWDDPVTTIGEDGLQMDSVYMGFISRQGVASTARMVNRNNELDKP